MFSSKEYRAWETLVLIAILFNCLISTYNAAFDSRSTASWVIVYVCDGLCIVNIIVSFFVTYIDKRGIYVTDGNAISRTYISKMFFWDILSVLPTDLIIFIPGLPRSYRVWRIVAAFRTNRLIGLRRVFRFIGYHSASTLLLIRLVSRHSFHFNAQIVKHALKLFGEIADLHS